ncbi:phosphoribosylformylglycinamidine synthase subunit PurQ [Metallumcola ferriviriculae]|uniref:Phosphoribosylformylglycinamidine synthase subunit PurQ n=1 Tax=Metallumcola ferriviriculae TaxID=3039180 RepID=A0AAU0USA0_9FIRM|nr:phosphoribosylformylglycinamidine synthase subunit PurQ [Desulfitibacteraceae bacterium MK1]
MKFGVVVFPGSNCDTDVKHAIEHVIEQPVDYIWHGTQDLSGYDCLVLPGGFSFGDYLRTGSIARFSPIMKAVEDFALQGGLVLGICNGFQILLEAGLLPGAMKVNDCLQFRCEDAFLRVNNADTPYTNQMSAGQVVSIPIAHGEGNYFADADTLAELKANDQIVFQYATAAGEVIPDVNPNGSTANIAGIVNKAGNILGMMPHPERCAEALLGGEDGKMIFDSILNWFEGGARRG